MDTTTPLVLDELVERPPRVIGVGLHKTSTTSLANALYVLGYRVGGHFDAASFEDEEQLRAHVVARAEECDAVQDMPWPAFYELLDETFPDARFVLTLRDLDRWLASVVTHFGDQRIGSHEFFYGVPTAVGYEDVYREHHVRHLAEVRAHFADRPGKLLEMDISGGDGWEALAGFLGHEVPPFPFPRQNMATARAATRWSRAARRLTDRARHKVGLARDDDPLAREGAVAAYPTVHQACHRVRGLVAAAALPGADPVAEPLRAGAWGVLRRHHDRLLANIEWAPEMPGIGVRPADDDWHAALLPVRRWAADITSDELDVAGPGGASHADMVRGLVDDVQAATTTGLRALETVGIDARSGDGLADW